MIVEELKRRIADAMRAKDAVAKDVLRVALGEIQTAEARSGGALDEAEAQKVIKKLVKSNDETLAATRDPGTQQKLKRENEVLGAMLPRSLGVDEIVAALAPVAGQIAAAKGDGPAMGLAMRHLRSEGATVEAPDVKAAIAKIRS